MSLRIRRLRKSRNSAFFWKEFLRDFAKDPTAHNPITKELCSSLGFGRLEPYSFDLTYWTPVKSAPFPKFYVGDGHRSYVILLNGRVIYAYAVNTRWDDFRAKELTAQLYSLIRTGFWHKTKKKCQSL